MAFLKKLDEVMTYIEDHLIAVLLIAMTAITFWGVITRFIINDPSSWAEEAARYLSIWAVFVGASLGVKKGAHIGVEAFVVALPKKAQRYAGIVTSLVCLVFCLSITYVGIDYTLRLMATGQLSPAMRIPIVVAYAAVPVGCFMMTVRYLIKLVEQCGSASDPDDEQARVENAI
ncbi:TRAP transporter small permease [Anaeroselena agilis]|uniref:TRAP transporter small permease n=1 Tax=Anaeroselena agilis TaxID=3063788 RepID=A0ABU3P0R7_9FIRM|nr:TRAP transporter small permease [Selenomonadales bacterium 4137-cl]